MYYRRGPIGLIIISILMLIFLTFIGIATGLINNIIYVLILLFGSPWLSKLIYIELKKDSIKREIEQEHYKKNRTKFLNEESFRVELYTALIAYKIKIIKTNDDNLLQELTSEYQALQNLYDKLIAEYIRANDIEYQCSNCKQPLKNTEKKCPFCGADTE